MKIAFIGAGKMAEALIARLSKHQIIAADIDPKRLAHLKKKYKIQVTTDNSAAFSFGDVVILAVKSQQMAEVLEERRASNVESRKLVISIVAGIPLSYLQKKLKGVDLVRAMPNNPCLVGHGITALNRESSAARKIFEAVGEVIVVPEKYIDAVTGLSGSGPAFIYLAIEAMTEAGRGLGLDKKVAGKLAVQTVLGSAKTMQMTGRSAKELREMVTSPGGTTIEGLKVLEKRKFSHALAEAIAAATKKAKLISQKWTS